MNCAPLLSLNRLPPGWRGKVTRVRAVGASRARLVQLGIMPGAILEKVKTIPERRGVVIRLGNREMTLTLREAGAVLVEVIGEPRPGETPLP
jgi:Fe2+ transport system protein FeoA